MIVISDDFKNKNYWERVDLLADAIYKVMKPIEAVAMTTEEWGKGVSMLVDFAINGEVVFSV